jgi:alpha-galactosidase
MFELPPLLRILLAATAATGVDALDNGLGLTPLMGWSNWNTFGCDIHEADMKELADKMIELGLLELGYE